MTYAIGIDIGGTKTAIAIVNQSGEMIEHSVLPTDLSIPAFKMIERMNREVKELIEKSGVQDDNIKGIGIGAPGPLDSKNGMITCPPNLETWVDIPIQKWVEEAFPFPVKLENDANVAALAEKWIGEGRHYDDYIYMTVSTGIGSGIIADGKLLRGRKGNAGDVGHMVVDTSFAKCSCGQYGCLEAIASGTAIAREGSKIAGKSLTTKEVFDLYHQGHAEIAVYMKKVFHVLGIACVSLINTFDTEKIIIGGGVSKAGDALFQPIREYVSTYALNPDGRRTKIVPSKLGQNSGVIGAAALWMASVL